MVERGNKGSFLYITLSVYAKILFFRKILLPHTTWIAHLKFCVKLFGECSSVSMCSRGKYFNEGIMTPSL